MDKCLLSIISIFILLCYAIVTNYSNVKKTVVSRYGDPQPQFSETDMCLIRDQKFAILDA